MKQMPGVCPGGGMFAVGIDSHITVFSSRLLGLRKICMGVMPGKQETEDNQPPLRQDYKITGNLKKPILAKNDSDSRNLYN